MFDIHTQGIIRQLSSEMLPGVDPAATLAVVDTESAGTVFWNVNGQNKPPMRFEGHYFYERLSGDKRAQAQREGLAHPRAGRIKNPRSYAGRYAMLERAMAINPGAAMESCSWGLGQVMGAHWKDLGYQSVKHLVTSCDSAEGQVTLMLRFVIENGIADELRRRDWHGFARVYNGPAYRKNRYAAKMDAAYMRYSGRHTGVDTGLAEAQKMLKVLGYYRGSVDGLDGPKTDAALRKFQRAQGLVVDGILGAMTLDTLEDEYSERESRHGDGNLNVGVGTGGLGGIGTVLVEQIEQIMPLGEYSPYIKTVMMVMLMAGIGLVIYGKVRKNR